MIPQMTIILQEYVICFLTLFPVDVIINVLASSAWDREFDFRASQTNGYAVAIFSFNALNMQHKS